MTDRELLELAAKAAGISAQWDCPERGMIMLAKNGVDTCTWNPLEDDGDALRLLAVMPSLWTLQLNFGPMIKIQVLRGFNNHIEKSSNESDRAKDIRRVIVRAAAEF